MTKCTKNSYNTVTENERFIRFRLNDSFRDAVSLIRRENASSLENENATILHPSNPDLLMQSHLYQFSVKSLKKLNQSLKITNHNKPNPNMVMGLLSQIPRVPPRDRVGGLPLWTSRGVGNSL